MEQLFFKKQLNKILIFGNQYMLIIMYSYVLYEQLYLIFNFFKSSKNYLNILIISYFTKAILTEITTNLLYIQNKNNEIIKYKVIKDNTVYFQIIIFTYLFIYCMKHFLE